MSERFTVVIDEDMDLIILCDSQKFKDYNLSDINDVCELCISINGVDTVKKENLERLKEISKDNELLYDAVNGFMALLELQFEGKI